MKKIILLLILFPSILHAQKDQASIQGRVFDSLNKKGLAYATISLVTAKDSSLIAFTRADSTGKFDLKFLPKGDFLLSSSYVGYLPTWAQITLKENEQKYYGDLFLTDVVTGAAVTVVAKRPPVTLNNDTLEFNTENFKTAPNAVVEDLLKRLPGVTVDTDGTIRVNGQVVRRVMVNGKEFFTGDPKLATKNLSADAVDKVQVYDRKSDRSQFTGIDDGNSETAINLQLKKDKSNALFGRVTAGAATGERYDGQFNINQFKKDKQISFLGMGNNVNKQGFSLFDVMNFSGELGRGMRSGGGGINIRIGGGGNSTGLPVTGLGQNQQGIAKTFAGGANWSETWKQKTDFNASIISSDINLNTQRNNNRQYILPGNNFNQFQSTTTDRRTQQQRINLSIDHKIDSFKSFKITPIITFQKNGSTSKSSTNSETPSKNPLNQNINLSNNQQEAFDFSNEFLFRKKFAKKGRTISLTNTINYNSSTGNGSLNSTITTFNTSGGRRDSLVNQTSQQDATAFSTGINITYTEPVGKRSLVEIAAFYNYNKGNSNKNTYDYNSNSGKHDLINTILTNHFNSTYQYKGTSLSFRGNRTKSNFSVGASLQNAVLEGINNTVSRNIQQTFTDVLPSATYQYNITKSKNIRLNYTTSTQQPSISQLQPIPNVSDPINIINGNPNLKRSYSHNLNLNFTAIDPFTRKNIFAFASINFTNNAIVYADKVLPGGLREMTPTNVNGQMNAFATINAGFPIKKLKSRVDLGLGSNYFKNITFLNGLENINHNITLNPSINYTYSLDSKIDIIAGSRISFSKVDYSLQKQLNANYKQYQYSVEMINYVKGGLVLSNEFRYVKNTGRTDGFNTSVPLWNASLAKSFLKNKRAELKFSAFDLLKQNIGINRTVNSTFVEDQRYNVLQRYFLLSFTFQLNKAGATSGGPTFVMRTIGN